MDGGGGGGWMGGGEWRMNLTNSFFKTPQSWKPLRQ